MILHRYPSLRRVMVSGTPIGVLPRSMREHDILCMRKLRVAHGLMHFMVYELGRMRLQAVCYQRPGVRHGGSRTARWHDSQRWPMIRSCCSNSPRHQKMLGTTPSSVAPKKK